ncbi:MAG: NAD(P)-binding protein [Bacteriovoracaceae bacterium]
MTKTFTDILIIGAGISGIHLANLIKLSHKKILLIDKAKGLGGRLATRRVNDLGIDHGLQYFKESEEITTHLQEWSRKGWLTHVEQGFVSPLGMTSLIKKMADGLDILKSQRASRIYQDKQWIVETDEGMVIEAQTVILTAPLPQASELLSASMLIPFGLSNILKDYQYDKSLLGIFVADNIPAHLKSFEKEGNQLILMREKNLYPQAFLYILSPERTEEIYSQSDHRCLEIIQKQALSDIKMDLAFTHAELKRWRYAKARTALASPFLEVQKNLFLIGDSFLSPDVTGSILSAEALAHHLFPNLE